LLTILLLLLAALCFLLAAVNQTVFSQGPVDLVAFGLFFWVVAILLTGVGPASPIQRKE